MRSAQSVDEDLATCLGALRPGSSEAAWAVVLDQALPILRAGAASLGHASVVEDAVQESVLALTRQVERTGGLTIANPQGWLWRTGRHAALRLVRAEARERLLRTESAADQPRINDVDDAAADADRLNVLLRQGLAALSERRRLVLEMRYFQGITHDEIAHRIGCTRQAVSDALSRGLDDLRERMRVVGCILPVGVLHDLMADMGPGLDPQSSVAAVPSAPNPVSGHGRTALVLAGMAALVLFGIAGVWQMTGKPTLSVTPDGAGQANPEPVAEASAGVNVPLCLNTDAAAWQPVGELASVVAKRGLVVEASTASNESRLGGVSYQPPIDGRTRPIRSQISYSPGVRTGPHRFWIGLASAGSQANRQQIFIDLADVVGALPQGEDLILSLRISAGELHLRAERRQWERLVPLTADIDLAALRLSFGLAVEASETMPRRSLHTIIMGAAAVIPAQGGAGPPKRTAPDPAPAAAEAF